MNSLLTWLESLNACPDALDWIRENNYTTLPTAWRECPRADWMLWLAVKNIGKPGWPTHQEIVLAACDCAEMALKYVPDGENRPKTAIDVARKWARGEATKAECREAAYAAAAAAAAADAAVAAAAAVAANYAAYDAAVVARYAAEAAKAAAYAVAYAVTRYAAAAVDAAAAAANAAADNAAARAKALRKMAVIVRKRLSPGEMT